MKKYIEESDLVIGIDRCILEAIAMKRIAVISGYENLGQIVEEKNIETEIKENFCGRSLNIGKIDELAKIIANFTKEEITNIVEKNYNQISKKLDINKNLYTVDINEYFYEINQDLIQNFIKLNTILGKEEEKQKEKSEEIWNNHIEYKTWIEQENQELSKIITTLEQENIQIREELEKVRSKLENSKISKIKEKIFGKK